MVRCRICGNSHNNVLYSVREMFVGTRELFPYFKCDACGCLQIENTIDDMSKYYPASYYSFKPQIIAPHNPVIKFLKTRRLEYWLTRKGILGQILATISKKPQFLSWLAHAHISPSSKVLDVGSGSGDILHIWYRSGFKNLTGIDPYIANDIHFCEGFDILKKNVADLPRSPLFDFIMCNHSLEHMPDQAGVLKKIRIVLQPHGNLLLRIPIVDSSAWNTYGVNWVQLDAPRHFYLHSLKSLSILAQSTGFEIVDTIYDSTEFQFWGSEQYATNIALTDNKSYAINPSTSMFTKEQLRGFATKARELNAKKQGDMACFVLRAL